MASQPASGFEWKRVIAAGSATLHNGPTNLHSVTVEVATGTVVLYDSASGTSVNSVLTTPTVTAPVTLTPDIQLKRGLYYLATGTPSITVAIG